MKSLLNYILMGFMLFRDKKTNINYLFVFFFRNVLAVIGKTDMH